MNVIPREHVKQPRRLRAASVSKACHRDDAQVQEISVSREHTQHRWLRAWWVYCRYPLTYDGHIAQQNNLNLKTQQPLRVRCCQADLQRDSSNLHSQPRAPWADSPSCLHSECYFPTDLCCWHWCLKCIPNSGHSAPQQHPLSPSPRLSWIFVLDLHWNTTLDFCLCFLDSK